MKRNLLILALIAVLVGGVAAAYLLLTPANQRGSMGMDEAAGGPTHPAVLGYAEGAEVRFIHPEASDPAITEMLTEMMGGSPVLVVPALADVPEGALGTVYVFTNEETARVLMSAAEVQAAVDNGEIVIEQPGIVVNMPFLTWPGGHR